MFYYIQGEPKVGIQYIVQLLYTYFWPTLYVRGIPLGQHKKLAGKSNYNIVEPTVTSTRLHER